MTVVQLVSGDLWAGAEVMAYHLLTELKTVHGVNVIAVSLNEGTLTEKLRNSGVETYVVAEKGKSLLLLVLAIYWILRGKRFHVIHSHRYKENLIALLLSFLTGGKHLIATLHGMPGPPLKDENWRPKVSFRYKLDYFVLRRWFQSVVAVSNDVRDWLVLEHRFFPEHVVTIHNGIPMMKLGKVKRSSELFHVGTVGRMAPVKDFHLFLEMAAKVREQTDRVHFSILGDGPLRNQLLKRVEELNLQDCVKFLPVQADPYPDHYRLLDVYINTSHHEGIPLSVLEAMACECPVIAPSVGGLPEIISNGEGVLINKRDANEFALWCLKLFENHELRTSLGRNGANKVASNFSSTEMALSYMRLYSN